MRALRSATTFSPEARHLPDTQPNGFMTARNSQHTEGRPALQRGRGFTLAEILVALALMALLAAVLLPTVAGQILKGDAGRVVADLQAVRGGVEQFLADVHRYPGKYSDMSTLITTTAATHTDILGNAYNAGMVSKWKGPYITKDTTNASIETGFGGSITNRFMQVTNTNAIPYLTVVVTGISGPDFDKIDAQIDGAVNRTSGLMRWVNAGGIDSTKYLAIPIQ
jgi:prepilin-type N-terminal cleavage/methylation domain-containing protein